MFQQKNNQKVVCNMYNLAPILVSNFPLLLLPTGSPLMKLWQFWPFQSPPDHPKCYLTAKSSPQPSIHIFRKSQKKLATFPIDFFRGIAKVWEGGHFTPPPASDRVNKSTNIIVGCSSAQSALAWAVTYQIPGSLCVLVSFLSLTLISISLARTFQGCLGAFPDVGKGARVIEAKQLLWFCSGLQRCIFLQKLIFLHEP